MKPFLKNCFQAFLCLYRSHLSCHKSRTPFRGQGAQVTLSQLRAVISIGTTYPCHLKALQFLINLFFTIQKSPSRLLNWIQWNISHPCPFRRRGSSSRFLSGTGLIQTSVFRLPSPYIRHRSSVIRPFTSYLPTHTSSFVNRTSYFLLLLTLAFLLPAKVAYTQTPASPVGAISALSVGDEFNYPVLENVLYTESGLLDLSAYRGKIIILDFWATWCAGCVASFPKNNELLHAYPDKLAIVAVTYEPKEKIEPFLEKLKEKKGWELSMDFVAANNSLAKIFPHQTLPHYVWIGPDGRVAAITEGSSVIGENIEKLLAEGGISLKVKKDNNLMLKKGELFLTGNTQYGKKPLRYQSALTSYIERLPTEYVLEQPLDAGMGRILSVNQSLATLALTAFGEGDNKKYYGGSRLILDVREPELIKPGPQHRGDLYREWKEANAISYELIYPLQRESEQYRFMQEDLKRFFPQYTFEVETREMEVWKIILSDPKGGFEAIPDQQLRFEFTGQGGIIQNIMLNGLVGYLNMYFMHDSPYPVVDATGISVPITLELDANMTDPVEVAAALRRYGLDMVRTKMPLDVLVIRDRILSP